MSFLRNRIGKFKHHSAPVDSMQAKFYESGEAEISHTTEESPVEDASEEDGSFLSDLKSSLDENTQEEKTACNDSSLPISPDRSPLSDEKDKELSKATAVVLSSDQEIYEMQLTQLQEQLVATMIENQALSEELATLKSNSSLKNLQQELSLEKAKNEVLIQRCEDMCHELGTEFVDSGPRQKTEGVQAGKGELDTDSLSDPAVIGEDALEIEESQTLGESVEERPTWKEKIRRWFLSWVYEVAADFSEDDEQTVIDKEGPQLTVKMLRGNVSRFGDGVKPLFGTFKGVNDVLSWKNPSLSALWFCTYMYFVWCGWFLPLVLFLLILRLFANYLRHCGWNINLQYFDSQDVDTKLEEEDKDKPGTFTIVLQVTRKVQNILGDLADRLEKINNLLTWEQPKEARDVFVGLCILFLISCLTSGRTLLLCAGLYFGVKLFIINNLYDRYPRLRRKYDREYQLWQSLMTNEQLDKCKQREQVEKVMLRSSSSVEEESSSLWDTGEVLPKEDKKFCDKFELPHTEAPLKGWSKGKNCLLLNKDKLGPSAVKPGLLYLTRSFLCWERTRVVSKNQTITIPLAKIESMEKHKPYSILPGSGMSILVRVVNVEKPYVFGGLFNRDENFDAIMDIGRRERLPWAVSCETSMPPGGKIRLSDLVDEN